MDNKLHIVITGRRNSGKSSLLNNILGQEKVIVSNIAGTTTDPIKKSYEVPGYATIIFTDTAGIDDEGALGQQRINKTFQAIKEADAAILVISDNCFESFEKELIEQFNHYAIPYIIVHNKEDYSPLSIHLQQKIKKQYHKDILPFSTHKNTNELLIHTIQETIGKPQSSSLIGDLLHPGNVVLLVTPIDSEAPTGRIILPQVQMIRDILDNHCINIVLQPEEITTFLNNTEITPRLVITDSQVFKQVSTLIPTNIPLTGFSIVLARHKGNFDNYLQGTPQIENLRNGDRILMLESCSHHISCEDIGHVKIPALLRKHTGKNLEFDFVAGLDQIKRPVTDYALVIQCGGCMITSRQLKNRLYPIIEAGIPVSNYGMTIAWLQGIFQRAIAPFQ